jgi:hypothetical protein
LIAVAITATTTAVTHSAAINVFLDLSGGDIIVHFEGAGFVDDLCGFVRICH